MRLDLNQHRKTDKTNRGQGQRALIESLQRELVEKRDAASSLSNCRSHKTGVLRALRLRDCGAGVGDAALAALARSGAARGLRELDVAGGRVTGAGLRALLLPLRLRRRRLGYRR